MPNRISALREYLKDDSSVASLVTGRDGHKRIYSNNLPDPLVPKMPVSCIVVRGGIGALVIGSRSFSDYSDSHVDVLHYAWTYDSAMDIYMAVFQSLKHLQRVVKAQTLIHWCNPVTGPMQMRDLAPSGGPVITMRQEIAAHQGEEVDKTNYWPFYIGTWHVMAADIAVT